MMSPRSSSRKPRVSVFAVAIAFSADDEQVQSASQLTQIKAWVTPSFGDRLQPGLLAEIHPEESSPALVQNAGATLEHLGANLLHLVEEALPRLGAAINQVLPAHRLVDIDRLRRLFVGRSAPALSVAFIKQFRDSRDGDRACYSRVFAAPARVTNTRLEQLGFGRRVSIANFASHPIASELGLLAYEQAGGVYEASLTFQLQFQLDMQMESAAPARRKKVAILGGGHTIG